MPKVANIEVRTSIMTLKVLADRVREHIEETGEDLSEFYNRAILNTLENDGDFEIRDLVEAAKAHRENMKEAGVLNGD